MQSNLASSLIEEKHMQGDQLISCNRTSEGRIVIREGAGASDSRAAPGQDAQGLP